MQQRVEIVIGTRTLLVCLAFAALVVLAILSLGTLPSIFLAAILAFGLDPIVSALVARGWERPRAALATFAGLFVSVFVLVLAAVGPVWDEVKEFGRALPGMWDDLQEAAWFASGAGTAGFDDKVREGLAAPRRAQMAELRAAPAREAA